jgi:hypothetical protein
MTNLNPQQRLIGQNKPISSKVELHDLRKDSLDLTRRLISRVAQ